MPTATSHPSAGLLEALTAPALTLDDRGVVLAVNRRWRESRDGCFGMTTPVEPGVRLIEAMKASTEASSDSAQRMIHGLEAVVAGLQDTHDQEFACSSSEIHSSNEVEWTRVELAAFDEEGGQRRVLLTRKDVTAEYRVDRALHESESRYHAVVEDQLELICRFLPDTTLTFVNQSYCKHFGKTREALLGQRFLTMVPASESETIQAKLAAFTPDRDSLTYEHEAVNPDGARRWQSWTDRAFFDEHGQVTEFQSVGRDITHFKQTQAALRKSEARFNELANHLDGVFWVFDWQARKMLYLSPGFDLVFGRPSHDLLADAEIWISAVHPDDREQVLSVFSVADARAYDLTYRIHRTDGEERWVRDRGYPVHDAAGRVVRIAGFTEDTTERVASEYKVQRSEERYRAASEAGLDAFFLLDAVRDAEGHIIDFLFTDLNQRGAALVSREREEVVGQRLCELLPVNRDERFLGAYTKVVETGSALKREFELDAAADGIQASWMEQQVVRVGDGIAINARDISDRKQNEQEITRQREENQTILDSLPAFVFYKDTENRILRVNKAVCDAEGLPADQIEGKHIAELYPEAAEAFHQDDLAVIRSRQPKIGYVEKLPTLDGGDRWIRTDKVPLYGSDREPVGVIAISMDVTELKQTSERLRESEERFRGLFDRVPVSVWEQDLTGVGEWLGELRSRGVEDLAAYLAENPDAIAQAQRRLVVRGVNQATCELFGADNLESLKSLLRDPHFAPPPEPWILKLQTIWSGQRSAEMETYCYNVDGKKLDVIFRLEIPEFDGQLDLSRAIVALTDISANRQRLFAQAQVTHAERERLILGHELHDTLAQQLTGINMLTESLRRRLASQDIPEAERVAELAGMVGQANSEVRRLISGLSVERIHPDEIETALESLADRSALVHQLPVAFHCLRTPDELSEDAANHLLFIAQEATHNAAKHAQASAIEITLDQGEHALTLTVQDDGVGLPPDGERTATPDSGLGLNIMRYRAEAIGATMTFTASPQAGTAVLCRLPTQSIPLAAPDSTRHDDAPGVSQDD